MSSVRVRHLRSRGLWIAALVVVQLLGFASGAVAQEAATITGRVTNEAGVGISGVHVRALGQVFYSVRGSAVTDSDGYYTMDGLAATATNSIVTFDPGASNVANNTDYVQEIYRDASAALEATLVPPGASAIDAVLAEGASIAGTVYASDGTPLSGVTVTWGSWMLLTTSVVSGDDGSYCIRGALPSTDGLRTSVAAYNATEDTDYLDAFRAMAPVAGQDLTGADLVLGQGGRIRGTVTGGGAPLEGVEVRAADANQWYVSYSGYTAGDGTYVLRGVAPGESYRVSFTSYQDNAANGTAYLTQYYNGVADPLSATLIAVTPRGETLGIDAAMYEAAPTMGSITGTVYGPDGRTPLEGVLVHTSPWMSWTYTLTDGTYELTGLAPGYYSLWFDATAYNEASDPDLLSEYYPTPVGVTAGAVASGVDAVLEAPVDTTPPSTGIQVSSGPGSGGWYLTEPLVTLTMSEPGTIWYTWGDGPDLSALSPATFAAPQGVNTLTYWSVDVVGNTESPRTMEFKVDTVAPAAPADLLATATGETTIDLSWTPVADDASGIGGYIILMDGAFLAEVSDTAYQATGLTRDTYHEFIVFALDDAGNVGEQSAAAEATTFRNPGFARRRYPERPEHP